MDGLPGHPTRSWFLSRAIAAMSDIALPTSPRTTLNIGTIGWRQLGERDSGAGHGTLSTCAASTSETN